MRQLVLRGGPYTEAERQAILDYCESDVLALTKLLPAMLPRIDLPRALLRGRYMGAAAAMEWTGTPIDTATLERLRAGWQTIKKKLISRLDTHCIYSGETFSHSRFAGWLARVGIQWPTLDSGRLALDDDTFKALAKRTPRWRQSGSSGTPCRSFA